MVERMWKSSPEMSSDLLITFAAYVSLSEIK